MIKICVMGGLSVISNADKLPDAYKQQIKDDLTFKKREYPEGETTIECYSYKIQEGVPFLFVPRNYPFYKGWNYETLDLTSTGFVRDTSNLEKNKTLGWAGAPQQPKFVETLQAKALENGRGGYGIADCGTGKTFMGLELAFRLGVSTMVIVPKVDIVMQWVDECEVTYSMKGLVGICRGKRKDCGYQYPVVIATWQTLLNITDVSYFRSFGCVILDECHRLPANKMMEVILPKLRSKYIFGFSAELYRSDGLGGLFKYIIGDVLCQIKKPKMKSAGKMYSIYSHLKYKIPSCMNYRVYMHNNAAKCAPRNQAIIMIAAKFLREGRNLFLFSATRKHLENIYEMMRRMWGEDFTGNHVGFYLGGMKKDELDVGLKRRATLITYMMGREALNAPWKDTLICCTPSPANKKQLVGRVNREMVGSEKKEPVVVEIVDFLNKTEKDAGKGREYKWFQEGLKVEKFLLTKFLGG